MRIYETRTAPNPRRVRMFLAEKGLLSQVEFVEIDIAKGDNLSDSFRQKNPLLKIPVLELDDGTCISETMAICRYFEAQETSPRLMGQSPNEQAHIEMWQRWCEFYFLLPTGMCFQHTTGYFKDRMTPIPAYGESCREQVISFRKLLDQHLAHNTYVAGDTFTVADITALCTVDFNRVLKLKLDDSLPHLQRWYRLVSERPSASA